MESAPNYGDSPYVCPAILDHKKPLSPHSYYQAWRRISDRAGVPQRRHRRIRHRSATDIANSGVPPGQPAALTATATTVAMFMRYVHTEDDPVRQAAELVATRRQTITKARQRQPQEATA